MWVKIRSWHAIRFTSRGGFHLTYCGRWARGSLLAELPDEKSCESCLRILARGQP